jgi:phosphoribosylanthranilate isomerase
MRPRIKICGLTRPEDARMARELGADYFGLVLYAKSPRQVREDAVASMLAVIPYGKRVAVEVAPEPGKLARRKLQGFDFFQVHFDPEEVPDKMIKAWVAEVGRERLWLAPRQPPGHKIPKAALAAAQTLVVDTYQRGTYGGTGRTGDWTHYKTLCETHPKHRWVLSGGLRPENIRAAVRATQAKVVDISSGIESEPGIKDPVKIDLFFANLSDE